MLQWIPNNLPLCRFESCRRLQRTLANFARAQRNPPLNTYEAFPTLHLHDNRLRRHLVKPARFELFAAHRVQLSLSRNDDLLLNSDTNELAPLLTVNFMVESSLVDNDLLLQLANIEITGDPVDMLTRAFMELRLLPKADGAAVGWLASEG